MQKKNPPEHFENRGDAAAAAAVETVNRVKKCFSFPAQSQNNDTLTYLLGRELT